ncbi:patatin-like phospholipase family protein [Roseovarius nitratireducens]|uniref:patatin-like phospholipase family protein n=1 Tax=Roseovarius nitratireducens TaxID=2044597 RepID=UPI00197D15EE|nr:patatin-like phospholipase family protein [Roseovarius nitratireducens]
MNTAETLPDGDASRVSLARGGTALVLCGGGGHGALEVGFARALTELGVRYDQILGTSIGAVNGAFLAGGMSADDLAGLWCTVRLRQLLRPNWNWVLHPRSRPGLLSLAAFGRLLERTLPARRFEDLRVPLTIVTTDLITSKACYREGAGDIIAPLLASVNLPGIFPPVQLDGHPHIDGGVAENAPLARAAAIGSRHALMIECACASPCRRPPSGLIGTIGRAFEIALARKHRAELPLHEGRMGIVRVVPELDDETGFLNLSQTSSLLEIGYQQSMAALYKLPECVVSKERANLSQNSRESVA